MPHIPIFVSATSRDLRSYRAAVADLLRKRGFYPVEQDTTFTPDYRTIREMLRAKIEGCVAVVHIAGLYYGAEPTSRPDGEPRRSYTQLEYEIAVELGRPVYKFVATEGCAFDPHDPEPEDFQHLQREHRGRLQSGDVPWWTFGTREELIRLIAPIAFPVPNPVASRLSQLPAVVADFTGREDEIRRMVGLLRGDGGRVGVSALRGMGGVGKTSLAVRVAHEVKDHFPDAQLVLELRGTSDQPMTAVEAMARVIRDFHPDAAKLPDTEAELLPVYRSVLAGQRALIVLDNAKDEEQVRHPVTAPPRFAAPADSNDPLLTDPILV